MDNTIATALLERLGTTTPAQGIVILRDEGQLADPDSTERTAHALATAALEGADTNPNSGWHWVRLAEAIADESEISPSVVGLIFYAQARLHVQAGDLSTAETSIRQAQSIWSECGDAPALQRSNLGLTQILTVQGRYAEATDAIRQTISVYEQSMGQGQSESLLPLLGARRNLATLLRYQSLHEEALSELRLSLADIHQRLQRGATEAELLDALHIEQAHQHLALAISALALDQIDEAESALQRSVEIFAECDDLVNRARAVGNLGELYLHVGQFGKALSAFDEVAEVLGQSEPESDINRAGQISEYLLNRGFVYLALNLLPEAEHDLQRCVQTFQGAAASPEARTGIDAETGTETGTETSTQTHDHSSDTPSEPPHHVQAPLELALALLALGQLYVNTSRYEDATAVLDQAELYLSTLNNRYWQNRLALIRATAAAEQQRWDDLAQWIVHIEQGADTPDHAPAPTTEAEAAQHDSETAAPSLPSSAASSVRYADLHMETAIASLAVRRHLALDEVSLALERTEQLSTRLDFAAEQTESESAWSQLRLWLYHGRGQIAQQQGLYADARAYYRQAIELLEAQRADLPFEEIRSAFLVDKTQIYTDLLLSYLDDPTSADESVSEALSLIERMRSRTLLERLVATLEEENPADEPSGETADEPTSPNAESDESERLAKRLAKRSQLRQELTWLYNQLLGDSGTRRSPIALTQEIEQKEQALRELEWKIAPELEQFEPIGLQDLQQILPPDQQIILYHIAHDAEILAIIIDQHSAQVVRRLCTRSELVAAYRTLRFQLGRVEVQRQNGVRTNDRLLTGVRASLHTLHTLLLQPIADLLTADRLQFIPTGPISLVPLHALWDGSHYLIQSYECSYAPSISIAALCKARRSEMPFRTFAGFGLTDESIPFADGEVSACAQYFAQSQTYTGNSASKMQLKQAAAQADVLHIATHGLYRFDNPFFSSLKLADGWLDVREIYRLPLAARLVVLSACESGVGQIQPGDENVGIARGFLGSGAHSLIVSLWNVHDETASRLMANAYQVLCNNTDGEHSRSIRPSAALRAAQLSCIEEEPHPYFWAAFVAVG